MKERLTRRSHLPVHIWRGNNTGKTTHLDLLEGGVHKDLMKADLGAEELVSAVYNNKRVAHRKTDSFGKLDEERTETSQFFYF